MSPFGLDDTTGEPLRDALGEIVSIDVDVLVGAVPSRGLRRSPWRRTAGTWSAPSAMSSGGARRASGWSWSTSGTVRAADGRGARRARRPARLVEDLDSAAAIDENVVTVTCGTITQGFVDEANRLVLVTGEDISGQKASTRDMRRMPARRKREIDPLELKAGDFVVHEQHGVGRFVEMKQREVGEATRSTSCWSTAPPSAGPRRTGSTCLPTRSTR